MHKVPLHPLQPPRNRPLLSLISLPSTPGIGLVIIFQSVSESKLFNQLGLAVSYVYMTGLGERKGLYTLPPCGHFPNLHYQALLRGPIF